MAADVLAQASLTDGLPGGGYTWSKAITVPSDSNRVMLFVAQMSGANLLPIVQAIDFSGVDISGNILSAINFDTYYRQVAYYLVAPGAGSKTLSITFAAQADFGQTVCAGTIYILGNVNQSTPFRTVASGTAATLSGIGCVTGDLLVDLCSSPADADPSGAGAGQTDVYSVPLVGSSNFGNMATSHKVATSISESMSWSAGFSGTIKHIAIPVIDIPLAFGSPIPAMLASW